MFVVRTRLSSSPIQGLGVYAAEPIAKGATVWREDPASVRMYTAEEIEAVQGPFRDFLGRYAYQDRRTGKFVLCLDDGRFMNHDDAPNTENSEDYLSTIAARDIAVGEEITCDYRSFDIEAGKKLGG